jgi:hypothetical protein
MVYIDLEEAKEHLHVDFDDDDAYIISLIDLVEELVLVEIQGEKIGEGTVATTVAVAVVGTNTNFLDYSVGDTITVRDADLGTVVTRTIATITSDTALTVTVAFAAIASSLTYVIHTGMSMPIPRGLKQAMLLMLGHFYNVREPILIGVNGTKIPYGYEYLVSPYKNWTIC